MIKLVKTHDHLVCVVAIDVKQCVDVTLEPMKAYADRINADFYSLNFSDKLPHLSKYDLLATAHELGYAKVLCIDADVYIRRGIPNVLNHYNNALWDEAPLKTQWVSQEAMVLFDSYQGLQADYEFGDPYYNAGVMIFDDIGLSTIYPHLSDISDYGTQHEKHVLNLLLNKSGLQIQRLHERWNTIGTKLDQCDHKLLVSYFIHAAGTPYNCDKSQKLALLAKQFP